MSLSLTSGLHIRISVLYSAYINWLAEPCCTVLPVLRVITVAAARELVRASDAWLVFALDKAVEA